MDVEKLRRMAYAAIPGGIGLAIGVAWAMLEELEYNGIIENKIPDVVSLAASAIGAILLMVSFTGVRKIQMASGGTSGSAGYWTAMVGLGLSVAWMWPLFIAGPLLIGIGVILYGASSLASGSVRSFGSWLHVLALPTAIVTGLGSEAAGYDGAVGVVVFMTMLIAGFMTLGFDAAKADHPQVGSGVTA